MRRPTFLFSAFIVLGCGDDGLPEPDASGGPGTSTGDDDAETLGSSVTMDTSTSGNDSGGATEPDPSTSDGSTTDGSTTGGPLEGDASVRVFDQGKPVAEAPVIFHRADGSVAQLVYTDGDGLATGPTEQDAMVTVAWPGQAELHTIVGVVPGDELVAGTLNRAPEPVGSLAVSGNEVVNADSYMIDAGCVHVSVPTLAAATLDVFDTCLQNGQADVFSVSRDAVGTNYSYATASGITLEGERETAVTLSDWSLDWQDVFLYVNAFPADAFVVTTNVTFTRGALPFRRHSANQVVTAGGTAISLFRVPETFADANEILVAVAMSGDGGSTIFGETIMIWRDTERQDAPEVSVSDDMLPVVTDVSVDATEVERPVVSWTMGAGADGTLVAVDYDTAGLQTWRILTPSSAASVPLPALPAELSALVPKSEPSQTTVTAVEADFVSDYPSLKSSSGLDVLNVPLQADTTIRWTTSLQHPVTPG